MSNANNSRLLEQLYDSSQGATDNCGSVLISFPVSQGNSNRVWERLTEDLIEVLWKSGFVPQTRMETVSSSSLSAEIILGSASPVSLAPHVYISYDGWDFVVSQTPPDDADRTPVFNNIISLLTASFAVSEVFRIRFGKELGIDQAVGIRGGKFFDFIDSSVTIPDSLDFGSDPVSWFGCGSVAFAAIYALRGLRISNGRFHFIDNDAIEIKNVRKYLGVRQSHLNSSKAEILTNKLNNMGAKANAYKESLNRYSREVNFHIPLAVICTDTSMSRRDLQAKLPRVILNAWTGNYPTMLQAGIYRYRMPAGGPCLICEYWNDVEGHPDMALLAQNSGTVPYDFNDSIRENEIMGSAKLQANQVGSKIIENYRPMCDTFHIFTGTLRREFSVPFVASIAGSLLALALICEGSDILKGNEFPRKLLRFALVPKMSSLFTELDSQRSDCICADEDYLNAYNKKWT